MRWEMYNSLAALLLYPEADYAFHLREALAAGEEWAIIPGLDAFSEATWDMDAHALQELFIQTFDLSPVCSLEMGWHLFGENYDRGLLLVKMRQQLRDHGLAETTELPDHLNHGLRLLARMERSQGSYFAEAIVLPAVEKMLQALRGKQNPYEHVLQAVRLAVRADFPGIPARLAIPAAEPELRVLA